MNFLEAWMFGRVLSISVAGLGLIFTGCGFARVEDNKITTAPNIAKVVLQAVPAISASSDSRIVTVINAETSSFTWYEKAFTKTSDGSNRELGCWTKFSGRIARIGKSSNLLGTPTKADYIRLEDMRFDFSWDSRLPAVSRNSTRRDECNTATKNRWFKISLMSPLVPLLAYSSEGISIANPFCGTAFGCDDDLTVLNSNKIDLRGAPSTTIEL
jgi:hypothetical protein